VSTKRIAVIGAGHLGKIHLRRLKATNACEIVAMAEPMAEVRQAIESEFGVATVEDYRQLLGRVDAVIIATPTANHLESALWCLENGIHCFVEKPLVRSARHADLLIHVARRRNLVLQVGHVERFSPTWQAAQSVIQTPYYVEATRTSGYTGRSTDIGVVFDLMIHDLDLILNCIDSNVVQISATGRAVLGHCEDVAEARLEFENGAIACVKASRISRSPQRKMSIESDFQLVELDFAAGTVDCIRTCQELVDGTTSAETLAPEARRAVQGELFSRWLPHESVPVASGNAIDAEHADFLHAIKHSVAPKVSGDDARKAISVAERILDTIAATSELRKHAREESELPAIIPAAHRFGKRKAS
jgi:predicted dehydrogenase